MKSSLERNVDVAIEPAYACPHTHAPLFANGDVLRTADSTRSYAVRAGIPQFLRYRSAEDDHTIAKLESLNRLARAKGWETALREVYADDLPLVEYVTDSGREKFMALLPVEPASTVLEIGPGLGQFTVKLARRAKCVYGLEVVPGQAEFAAERCRQEGVSNAYLAAGGDDCRLPYASGMFDLVVLNLVFEWCASRCEDEAIAAVQARLLAEMARVLKPRGALYLATKNRYALKLLIGRRDEHCQGLRFGSALPRWLGDYLVRKRGYRRRAGMLYSHDELKALLRNAGFESVRSFWAAPEMRYPTHYVETDSKAIRSARRSRSFVQGEFRSTRLLMPLMPAFIVKYFTPGLAFLATKRA